VLTHTDKFGNVRPVGPAEHAKETGKRQRKKRVATHDKDGLRERYFANDDKFDLKSMVRS